MKFFGMGGFELVIILIVILLIFGPKNLPKLGSALGKTMSNLRSGMNDGKKKKAEEEKPANGEEPDGAENSKPAVIEGEVETVEDAAEEPEAAAEPSAEAHEANADAPAADDSEDTPAESSDAPKKVRRVVKKKVVADAPEE